MYLRERIKNLYLFLSIALHVQLVPLPMMYTNPTRSDLDKYVVTVIENRNVSNEIASDLHITHQSPQAFLVQNKKALWNASHSKITGQALENAIKNFIK
ncbi:general stress protein [Lederbergia lenta]|uniref:General stress protein n=2 Tax=Lederbergia lenta TaxID=1467 RepID=A0A2X4WKE8_LEDLE|nr:general stress protein [Lederbergia lenta]